MVFYRGLILTQTIYILITGLWPLVHIDSFMAVTGPKHDVWLVRTVGALLIPVGLTLFTFYWQSKPMLSAIVLGCGVAISFIFIDCYYASKDIISDIYLLDALIELAFLLGWVWILIRWRSSLNTN
jgi:hypothetical protein